MEVLDFILQFINVTAAAIVAGGQLAVLLVIVPVKREFPTELSVRMHVAMLGHQIDRYMKPSGIVSILSAIALLAVNRNQTLAPVAFTLLGMLGTVGVVILSRYFNVRTNKVMSGWSLDAIPAEYPQIRDRWDKVHTIRASCGMLGLTGYLIAALLR